jgi:hypothetical protein
MTWNWHELVAQVLPVVVGWLLGALGIGPRSATPPRLANKE